MATPAFGLGAESIAFPAIASGIYGFPLDRAAEIATRTVRSLPIVDRILLLAFDRETYEAIVVTLGEDHGRSVP